ncbi:DUF742 domain-containing protein [Actinomadura harenae]|uniref:DUF742 domain-containing protein n=1 Tax=Actinomadura harenae TaxID=2483351 RepID=A0A3M2MAN1_9ACTN|nr:DUF742 domain-containing protein [Actinomadura harenae]RMI46541.1 DUF742 domain-containing protein [Actinomadura harenae]
MSARRHEQEDPDRYFTITGGRRDASLDLVALVVAEIGPLPGMSSEQVRILRLCRDTPVAVVELSAHLALPVSVVRILLRDMLADGRITVRHPVSAPEPEQLPDLETLKQVLVGLHNL